MVWIYIYAVGVVSTFFLTILVSAYHGKETDESVACTVSSIVWPLSWIYAIAVSVGRKLKKKDGERS